MSFRVLHSQKGGDTGPRILVHGGAGPRATELTLETSGEYEQGLRHAVTAGSDILAAGGTALDAACAAVVCLEDDPLFNAARGASLTLAGTAELDAAVMTGDGRAGAVAASRLSRNPVLAARAVLEKSGHVLLVNPDAAVLGQWGLQTAEADYFVTEHRMQQLKRILSADDTASRGGTVGAVTLDRAGHIACATSTGGMAGQSQGRLGDTALIGAGTYAAEAGAAVSCTGEGEAYIKGVVAHDIAARVRLTSCGLLDAVRATYDAELATREATGGTIALTPGGELVIAHNSNAMFAGYWDGSTVQTFV